MIREINTQFFTFNQNNSGGRFDNDRNLAQTVVIEAVTAEEANAKLTQFGGYFNGVDGGMDCESCGDRWYQVYASDGTDKPMYYHMELTEDYIASYIARPEHPFAYIHYMDGTKTTIPGKKVPKVESEKPMAKKRIVSAGFLIKSSSGKYLIVRPSGKTGTTGGWGVPKGKRDPGEDIFDTAVREVFEETGLHVLTGDVFKIEHRPFHFYTVEANDQQKKQKYNKKVFVFRAYCDASVEQYHLECTTMLDCGKPEVDQFEWVTVEKAHEMVVKSQKGIFEKEMVYDEYNAAESESDNDTTIHILPDQQVDKVL